ncbi:hypothetical protein EJB05_33095 [Eragrostis curvula]|uniref:Uncharacterized protein n=1 Tax=Eragrostis curvula TaxID=38414 RepID=A0A5J9U087_9POAL|nr:hypothetical protein EJB05_33095 [Eragrostis curvula]
MAPPDQGSGALRRQTSCTCTCSGYEPPPPQHERRRLSSAASFSSPAASPAPSSASTDSSSYHPAPSHKSSSCESIPFAADDSSELGKLSSSVSSASSSSYESFLHIDPDCLDFDEPGASTTRVAPAAQAMYDPKRLPSAMFRTKSTNPAEWSVTSNDSLFSIQLSSCTSSGRYGDVIFYDAARFPSSIAGTDSTGGLCLREDCARCNGTTAVRKAVRFAATDCVSYADTKRSAAGFPTAANATAEVPAAASTTKTPEEAAGWCQFACCWPSLPTLWWPRSCAWNCHCCGCWC